MILNNDIDISGILVHIQQAEEEENKKKNMEERQTKFIRPVDQDASQ